MIASIFNTIQWKKSNNNYVNRNTKNKNTIIKRRKKNKLKRK